MTRFVPLLAAASALALAACAVGPDYQKPQAALTGGYHTPLPTQGAATTDLAAWWRGFGDPELTRIVERAAAQNLDVAQAAARVRQSRAALEAAGAALAPRLDAQGSAADGRQSLLSPIGEIGSHLPGFQRRYDDDQAALAASWEIDLFGGLRREREAARAEDAGARVQLAAVRTSIEAEGADAYLQARGYQARLAVARAQAKVEEDLLKLVNERLEQGVSAEREGHQTEAALQAVRATIPPLAAGLNAELNRLDVLMGAQPGTYRVELETDARLPEPPGLSERVQPGDLMRRRPDVLAAEQRLIAANSRIGVAISDYYPKISLSSLFGAESLDAGKLFTGPAQAQQLAAGFRWRLFDFGRVDVEVASAKGREAEALAAYRATALRAAEEVETSLSDLQQDRLRAQALGREVDQLTVARRQAQQAYEGGVASLLEVRDADRDLLTASDQLVQSQVAAARAAVATFRALGGGWRQDS
ncbi:efflux transporter outer membrane subunit [Phenylobacterium sp.]|jgi:NodT family efflux transporter outer membrane factor (OMF) lipoprotein|uniref:efflux transporter outer membrane subunit n=1 Tax=Phenylobacterium sp. TaxID=1871053 RepID=UPI0011F9295F|nr:efflux transporter outer membrane subunit [Phenylobacterium sp.]THD72789.1 MAG: efflux transporter outer membrane subunit [Phenylobacterium sp.]